jgi:hypothetical protein
MHRRLPILVIANCQFSTLPIANCRFRLGPAVAEGSAFHRSTVCDPFNRQLAIGNRQSEELAITRIGNWQSEMLLVLPTVQQESLRQNSVAAIIQARLTNR